MKNFDWLSPPGQQINANAEDEACDETDSDSSEFESDDDDDDDSFALSIGQFQATTTVAQVRTEDVFRHKKILLHDLLHYELLYNSGHLDSFRFLNLFTDRQRQVDAETANKLKRFEHFQFLQREGRRQVKQAIASVQSESTEAVYRFPMQLQLDFKRYSLMEFLCTKTCDWMKEMLQWHLPSPSDQELDQQIFYDVEPEEVFIFPDSRDTRSERLVSNADLMDDQNAESSGFVKNLIDVDLNDDGPSPCSILQALTLPSSDASFNLECLKTIGLSFLKYVFEF